MNIEKEVRYLINKEQYKKLLENTSPLEEEVDTLDLTFGYDGFNSLSKYGFVCRVRQKKNKIVIEIKNKIPEGWLEQEVKIDTLAVGVNFFKCLNMKPYMYLYKKREVRKFKDLKIFIDKVESLGDFVEIEYQDCNDSVNQLSEFKKVVEITSSEEDLYGNIIQEKLKDQDYKNIYETNLYNLIAKITKGEN